ncbi:MAG: STAS domain-containing protein [Deltaproteobacteria bacterium]|jgi:anti-sigma B factor antagonist|nr:STAS domain-containing protein [Deltaproteobacteria bacterium]
MEIQEKNDVTVIVMDERFDAALGRELKDIVQNMGDQTTIKLVIDLSKTSFIDSSASGALVFCWRSAKKNNGDMKITGPSDHVKSLFRLTRIDTVVKLYDNVEAALESFAQNESMPE